MMENLLGNESYHSYPTDNDEEATSGKLVMAAFLIIIGEGKPEYCNLC